MGLQLISDSSSDQPLMYHEGLNVRQSDEQAQLRHYFLDFSGLMSNLRLDSQLTLVKLLEKWSLDKSSEEKTHLDCEIQLAVAMDETEMRYLDDGIALLPLEVS